MKKSICVILILLSVLTCFFAVGCNSEDECEACGGTGYFQKKDCPFC